MYMPFRQEVDIRALIEEAWDRGKAVYLPKADPEDKKMAVYEVSAFDELEPGAYGIQEPVADDRRRGWREELDLILLPGVVFDRHGYRIGYGGGYYDRFLPTLLPRTLLIGVAFSWQVVDCVPYDAHDQPLDGLVTEEEVYMFTTEHSRNIHKGGTKSRLQ